MNSTSLLQTCCSIYYKAGSLVPPNHNIKYKEEKDKLEPRLKGRLEAQYHKHSLCNNYTCKRTAESQQKNGTAVTLTAKTTRRRKQRWQSSMQKCK